MTSSGCAPTVGLHVHCPISVLVTPVTSNTMVTAVSSTVHSTLYMAVVVTVHSPVTPLYGGEQYPHAIQLPAPVGLCKLTG